MEGITGDYVVGGNLFEETQPIVSAEDVDSLKKCRLVEMHFICDYFDEKDEIDWEYVNARNWDRYVNIIFLLKNEIFLNFLCCRHYNNKTC